MNTAHQDFLASFFSSTGKVNAQQAAQFASAWEFQELTKNTVILKVGDISNEYCILQEGIIRAFAYDVNGNEITTWLYSEGQPVFEVNSFFAREPTLENMVTVTSCKLWRISFEELNKHFHAFPEFREMGRYLLVKGFAALKQHSLQMITTTAEERYEQLLKKYPKLIQEVPLKHLATYLGVTDTSLSRIRAKTVRK